MRAMPSPTCSTVPTSRDVHRGGVARELLADDLRDLFGANLHVRSRLLGQAPWTSRLLMRLEPAPHGAVVALPRHPHEHAPDDPGVEARCAGPRPCPRPSRAPSPGPLADRAVEIGRRHRLRLDDPSLGIPGVAKRLFDRGQDVGPPAARPAGRAGAGSSGRGLGLRPHRLHERAACGPGGAADPPAPPRARGTLRGAEAGCCSSAARSAAAGAASPLPGRWRASDVEEGARVAPRHGAGARPSCRGSKAFVFMSLRPASLAE